MKIIIIYDCPLHKCDKLWVYKELYARGYNVKVIDSKYSMSRLNRKGFCGKLYAKIITLYQSINAVLYSNQKDIILCWNRISGVSTFCIAKILFMKRKILSLNWLNPSTHGILKIICKNILKDKNFIIAINSKENKNKILNYYQASDIGNIFYFPDVFDDSQKFNSHKFQKNNRYCFTGGMSNRDWTTLIKVAELNTDVVFKLVALKKDWNNKLKIPKNVKLYFDTTSEKYYKLLSGAYIVILPLKHNKASGLINIIKSIQYGVICITTSLSVTRVYYPDELHDYLTPISSAEIISKKVIDIYNYSEDSYNTSIYKLQCHLVNNFSPQKAVDRIENIINHKKWLVSA